MKVVQVVPTIGPGGAETLAFELAREFARRGHESTLIVLCDARGERGKRMLGMLLQDGVNVRLLHASTPKSLRSLLSFVLRVNVPKDSAVISHLYSAEVHVAIARMFGRIRARSCFAVFHNSIVRRKEKYLGRITKFLGVKYIGCSKRAVEALARVGVSSVRIDNGIQPPEQLAVSKALAPTGRISILMVGNLRGGFAGQKGVDIALNAMKVVPGNYHLTIAGLPDSDLIEIGRRVESLGVFNKVSLRGSFESFESLVTSVGPDVLWMPSRFEGLPMVIMEASMMGLPVVASDIPPLTDIYRSSFIWRFFSAGSPASLAEVSAELLGDLEGASTSALDGYVGSARESFSIRACTDSYEHIIGFRVRC